MKEVVIASENPVKINSVKEGFHKMFPGEDFSFSGVSVPSNVSDQPISNSETFKGALNRADFASDKSSGADFYVGIEGGVQLDGDEMESFAWVVIRSGERIGKSRTASFYLPKEIVKLIKGGKELGEADDIVFKCINSKQENGAVGILTDNIIDRTKYYTEAVVLSLIPFKNKEIY